MNIITKNTPINTIYKQNFLFSTKTKTNKQTKQFINKNLRESQLYASSFMSSKVRHHLIKIRSYVSKISLISVLFY